MPSVVMSTRPLKLMSAPVLVVELDALGGRGVDGEVAGEQDRAVGVVADEDARAGRVGDVGHVARERDRCGAVGEPLDRYQPARVVKGDVAIDREHAGEAVARGRSDVDDRFVHARINAFERHRIGERDRTVRSAGYGDAGECATGERRAVAREGAVETVEPHAASRAAFAVVGEAVVRGDRGRRIGVNVVEIERVTQSCRRRRCS